MDQTFHGIEEVVSHLCDTGHMRHVCPTRPRPDEPHISSAMVERIVTLSRELIFPGFFMDDVSVRQEPALAKARMTIIAHELRDLLAHQVTAGLIFSESYAYTSTDEIRQSALHIAEEYIESLPALRDVLSGDIDATFRADPAAVSTHEVIACYPGLRATMSFRFANLLHRLGVPILPRVITEQAHSVTGIDIHPGATIGQRFVIDHGTGVVIGETTIIGNNVTIYQGVTLGARSFVTDEENVPVKGIPRHPIIGNNVVIYSNTTILGRVTVGDGAVIGGNLWVCRNVSPGERLVQARADNYRSFPSSLK